MALIKCPDCGKKISDKSRECIKCGCPIEIKEEKDKENKTEKNSKKKYKKMFLIGSLVLVALVVVGSIIFYNYKTSDFLEENGYKEDVNQILIISEYINVRLDASPNSMLLGKVESGQYYDIVDIVQIDDNIWYKILSNDYIEGYVAGHYNGEDNVQVLENVSIEDISTTKKKETTKKKNTTKKKETTKKVTNKPHTQAPHTEAPTTDKPQTTTQQNTTTKAPTTQTTTTQSIKQFSIGSVTGIGNEFVSSRNVCRLDSLNVRTETSKYSDYVKFYINAKMTKVSNNGICSISVNFYDEAGVKIGNRTLYFDGLAEGESGVEDIYTYSRATIDSISGSIISVKVD